MLECVNSPLKKILTQISSGSLSSMDFMNVDLLMLSWILMGMGFRIGFKGVPLIRSSDTFGLTTLHPLEALSLAPPSDLTFVLVGVPSASIARAITMSAFQTEIKALLTTIEPWIFLRFPWWRRRETWQTRSCIVIYSLLAKLFGSIQRPSVIF